MSDLTRSVDLYGDGVGRVELIDYMGSDLSVVNAARVSFGVEKNQLDDKDRKLIKYLISHRHTSTLEHCFITYKCVVPLFVRSQHHRHRTWSYNEWSNRYRDLSKDENHPQFYEPSQFRTQHATNRQASNENELADPLIDIGSPDMAAIMYASTAIKNWNTNAVQLYNKLIAAGVCREQARGILPQNMYTEYIASCNLNNLLKFIELRTHDGAQWEIQKLAKGMLQIAEGIWPETIAAYREVHRNSI